MGLRQAGRAGLRVLQHSWLLPCSRPARTAAKRPDGAGHADCASLIPLEDGFSWDGRIDLLIPGYSLTDHAHGVRADTAQTRQSELEEDGVTGVVPDPSVTLEDE